jgi:hypothetical protein
VVAKTLEGTVTGPTMFETAAAAIRAGKMPREYQMYVAQQYNAKNPRTFKSRNSKSLHS